MKFPKKTKSTYSTKGFTLVELLVVIGIILIMMAAAVPALTGIVGASDLTKTASDISGILEQARAHAMGKSTYVWVCFFEADANVSPASVTPRPQIAGTGRVTVGVFASEDGTRYRDTSAALTPAEVTTFRLKLVQLGKLSHFQNVHLERLNNGSATNRPVVNNQYEIGDPAYAPNQPLTDNNSPFFPPVYPATLAPQYRFRKVIEFSPRGEACKVKDLITPWLEIGLVPTHGTELPPVGNRPNIAAIQIAGVTGAVKTYRPDRP